MVERCEMFGHLVYSPQYATFLPRLVRIDCSGETYRMSDINAQLGCSLKAIRSSAVMCRRAVGRKPSPRCCSSFHVHSAWSARFGQWTPPFDTRGSAYWPCFLVCLLCLEVSCVLSRSGQDLSNGSSSPYVWFTLLGKNKWCLCGVNTQRLK